MKNLKSTKLVAALAAAGAISLGGNVHAAAINPDGQGEVLLFPFYTVAGGNATLLSIVNTTNQGKIVKIRFRESMNSEDVRDFNIYLSAEDVWTGAILRANGNNQPDPNGDRAGIFTQDTSCTGPHATFFPYNSTVGGVTTIGVAFTNSDYYNHDNATRGSNVVQDHSRTLQGYFEVIEQATIPTSSTMYQFIDHRRTGGRPNCNGLYHYLAGRTSNALPSDPNGSPLNVGDYAWVPNVASNIDEARPSGGLFGSAAIINVGNGASTAYSAIALNGFDRSRNATIRRPGSELPSLIDSNTTVAAIITDRQAIVVDTSNTPVTGNVPGSEASVRRLYAATLPFFSTNVQGEYFYSNDLAAATDWVVTFPQKRSFVTFAGSPLQVGNNPGKAANDVFAVNNSTTIPPFATGSSGSSWRVTGSRALTSSVGIEIRDFDREEQGPTRNPQQVCIFSPCAPDDIAPGRSLVHEVNVISFGPENSGRNQLSGALSAKDPRWLEALLQTPGVGGGWMDLSFTGTRPVTATVLSSVNLTTGATVNTGTATFSGLPVIGFQATSAKSIQTEQSGAVRDNYRHSSNLSFRKSVEIQ